MPSVDALRKTILAKYSSVFIVSASRMRTPLARPVSLSYKISVVMALGLSVRLPVAAAAGKVAELDEKYPLNGHPWWHLLRNWQGPRVPIFAVWLAARPMIMGLPIFVLRFCATISSTQFICMAGWNSPSGSCGSPSRDPLMPANFST